MGLNTYTPQPGTVPARVIAFFHGAGIGREVATGVLADELGLDSGSLTACLAVPRKNGALVCENRAGLNYWKLGDGRQVRAVGEPDESDDAAPVQRVVKAPPSGGMPLLDVPRFPGVVVQASPPKPEPPPQAPPRGAPPEAKGPHALKPLGWLTPPDKVVKAEPPPSHANPPDRPGPAPVPEVATPVAPITRESAGQAGPGAGAPCAPAAPVCHNGTPAATLTPPAPMRCAVWSDGTLAIEKDGRTETYTPEETRAIVRYLERTLVGSEA